MRERTGQRLLVGAVLTLLTALAGHAGHAVDGDEPPPAAGPGPAVPAPPGLPTADDPLVLREALAVSDVGRGARSLVHTDAVEALLVAGAWTPPAQGEVLQLASGTERRWARLRAGEDGAFAGAALEKPTYLSVRVVLPAARVLLLHGVGHDVVYVNGGLRPGDPYGYGWWRLPVALRAGENELLFRVSRGRLAARLLVPPASWYVEAEDALAGDLVADAGDRWEEQWVPAQVTVVNATAATLGPLDVSDGDRVGPCASPPWTRARIPPLSVGKVPLLARVAWEPEASDRRLAFTLRAGPGSEAAGALALRQRRSDQVARATYVSRIDGSVQYAALRGPAPGGAREHPPAVLLTLHGAGVEATAQAEAYGPKTWLRLIAPTNRRPFGFDWEGWGRLDALEALEHFGPTAGEPLFLSGHSMGGHGAWHLGVTFPDRWQAVAPSAGWVSFRSYGGAPAASDDPVLRLLERAALPSDTLALLENLRTTPVHALHGDADDNVPVSEMRTITAALRGLGGSVTVHEQPGAGHWWDVEGAPGADCVDFAPLMAWFQRVIPAPAPDRVEFVTAHPGVSARRGWVSVLAAQHPFQPCRVQATRSGDPAEVEVVTENVEALALHLDAQRGEQPTRVVADGHALSLPRPGGYALAVSLRRDPAGVWGPAAARDPRRKHPGRCGPFPAAFDHGFQLVYGTAGTPEETAWALAKARLDAEAWTYRANGRAEVLSDVEYLARNARDRSVILYGHREMNAAWGALVPDGPVDVGRGRLRVGARVLEGDDLCLLSVRPHPRSASASVGIVAGTGMAGLRLTERLPYFASGVAIPDWVVLRTDLLTHGDRGVRGAGFFGNDWAVESGESAWR